MLQTSFMLSNVPEHFDKRELRRACRSKAAMARLNTALVPSPAFHLTSTDQFSPRNDCFLKPILQFSMAPDVHRPLRQAMIRLVDIQPGPCEDPIIRCNVIRHQGLVTETAIEALSCTWGAVDDPVTIFCGSSLEELSVTRNCCNALRPLRLSDVLRRVWIDAISNQMGPPERSDQVRMIGDIFGSACGVVVYLGEDDDDSRNF